MIYKEKYLCEKLKWLLKVKCVCTKCQQKISTAESKWHRDFCWRSGNSVKRKTTPRQPNPGISLFRRHS
jgi:hypothetical protein